MDKPQKIRGEVSPFQTVSPEELEKQLVREYRRDIGTMIKWSLLILFLVWVGENILKHCQ